MLATIDIGTNSVRLLIAQPIALGNTFYLQPVVRELQVTRLGQGVNSTGKLARDAINRTCLVLRSFQEILQQYPVEQMVVIATSAVRDAVNRQEFVDAVKAITGWDVTILSGKDEAEASFLGACQAVRNLSLPGSADVLVMDIGGGSTELIHGRLSGEIIYGGTSQIGSVRMTEMAITQHPVSTEEMDNLRAVIRERASVLVEQCSLSLSANPILIGVGGTITTLAALDLGLTVYDADKVTGFVLTKQRVAYWVEHLAKLTIVERAVLPGMSRGREDVIVAGAAIADGFMDLLGVEEIVVSDGDLMQGIWYKNANASR